MLFQNVKDTENHQLCISEKTVSDEVKGKRALDHRHISQELVPCTKSFVMGKIPDSFKINPVRDSSKLEMESTNQFLLWSLTCYSRSTNMPIHSTCGKPSIPSFTAINSLLLAKPERCVKSRIAFIPIIPYPPTYFDTIYTCMVNFRRCYHRKTLN